MKIKIPPYPNFKITEKAFKRDVESKSVKKNDSIGISNHLILVAEFKTGERTVLNARPVKHKDKTYITAFPNPVHLYLSLALEHNSLSEKIKETKFPKCGKKFGNDLYILDIDANGTHECYNDYIKYRISSIIMLVSSVEAFLNHIIPDDFKYTSMRNNKKQEFDKADIESPKISFQEKLTKIIPQYLKNDQFWINNQDIKNAILDLYEHRRSLIHLKTNSEKDFDIYFKTIDKMIDFDINSAVNCSISFMNKIKPDFILIEKEL
jgi:hypothetical protein